MCFALSIRLYSKDCRSILFFLFHRMKTNAQNTTEVFLSVMSVKCDFSSSTSMTNNDWISLKRIIIRSVFIRFQCNTEYLLYMCACICIYYINCRCMIVLFCLPWLFWSAEDNVRATFCLIYTHIHTNTYKWRTENYFGL